MATFVFVHGSFHGAWCWERVRALLEAEGHTTVALDLPGRGGSPAPVAERTLHSYAQAVGRALSAAGEPAVLVAHSMGGVIATQAAEWQPGSVRRLVYVCAFLPRDGQCLLDLATTDTESAILPALVLDEARGVHSVLPAAHREVFFGDCSPEDADAASARLVEEALAPVATPVQVSAERHGRVPRSYVRTLRDRCLTPTLQARMLAASPCERVHTLDTDHSPFLSDPAGLAHILAEEARA